MINLLIILKQLFCRHDFYYYTYSGLDANGIDEVRYRVKKCRKCGIVTEFTEISS